MSEYSQVQSREYRQEVLKAISDIGRQKFETPFCEETKKYQVILIASSLLAAGVFSQLFAITELSVIGVKASVKPQYFPRIAVAILLLYFAIAFLVRAAGDLWGANYQQSALNGDLVGVGASIAASQTQLYEDLQTKRGILERCLRDWPASQTPSFTVQSTIESYIQRNSLLSSAASDVTVVQRAFELYKDAMLDIAEKSNNDADTLTEIGGMIQRAEDALRDYADQTEHSTQTTFNLLATKELEGLLHRSKTYRFVRYGIDVAGPALIAIASMVAVLFAESPSIVNGTPSASP